MAQTTNDIKNGSVLNLDGQLWTVIKFQHVKPGKGPAFVRTTIKNVLSGKIVDKTFNAGMKMEFETVDNRNLQYSYEDGDNFVFMDMTTYDQRALNTLYEADEKGQDILSLLAERIEQPGAQTPLPDYAIEIVRGVAEHIAAIDAMLDEHSTGWKVKRMGVVDRNILRIAAWEIMFNNDVPNMVAIDEALSLAKTLCDDDSPAFIHGLLSAVSADAEATEVAEQPTELSAE